MSPTIKKVLKISAITLASLIAFVLVAIAIVINFIFTPAKITPIVEQAANEILKAEVNIGEVDITFFSSFPRFGLRIKDGEIVSGKADSTVVRVATDSLLYFGECDLVVSPLAYLTKNEVNIHRVLLKDAKIYAYVDELGKANWDIFPTSEEQDTTTTESTFNSAIAINRIAIENGSVTFDDRTTKMYAQSSGINLEVKGDLSQAQSEIRMALTTENNIVWQEGKLLVSKTALGVTADLSLDRSTRIHKINEAVVDINGLILGAKGGVQLDSLKQAIAMDIELGLHAPNLGTVLKLIPTSIVKEAADVKASGEVALKANLKGYYGKGMYPIVTGGAWIKQGQAKYKRSVYAIDNIDLKSTFQVDLSHKQSSFVTIEHFNFKAASTDLTLALHATNLLTNPKLDTKVSGKVNFTELAKTFPLQEGVSMKGIIDLGLSANLALADLNKDLSKVDVKGKVKIEGIALESKKDTFEVVVAKAGLAFGSGVTDAVDASKKALLSGIVGFDGLKIRQKNLLMARLNDVSLNFQVTPSRDTTSVGYVRGQFKFADLAASKGDSITIQTGRGETNFEIGPSKRNAKRPVVTADLRFDSINARFSDMVAMLDLAGFNVELVQSKNNPKLWMASGTVGFNKLQAFTPAFPLLAEMTKSKITFNPDYFSLNNTQLQLGSSNVALSGKIYNIINALTKQDEIKGDLSVRSDLVDCNELMRASDAGAAYVASRVKKAYSQQDADAPIALPTSNATEYVKKDTVQQKSEPMSVFVVPAKINFNFDTHIKKVIFGDLVIGSFKGGVQMKDQTVNLTNLSFNTLGASMRTSATYKATDKKGAYAGFDLGISQIDIKKVFNLIPSIDSLLPMLRSFEGVIDFDIAGETKLNDQMHIVLPSLRGAMSLHGENLVLLDGETFSDIAKMLGFKQKDRNLIDSISVDLLVKDGAIEVFPFVIKMDKYMAALGGQHRVDMTFDYHISALSPIKLGVNVKGKPGKMKIGLGSAKYKDLFLPTRKKSIDSTQIIVRDKIRNALRSN